MKKINKDNKDHYMTPTLSVIDYMVELGYAVSEITQDTMDLNEVDAIDFP